VVVDRPPETVFDFVADARREPRYNPLILPAEKLSEGPLGVGRRFLNETASIGRKTRWAIEITSYERPRRLLTLLSSSAMDINGTMRFDPAGTGTLMAWSWNLEPRGPFRLVATLIKGRG